MATRTAITADTTADRQTGLETARRATSDTEVSIHARVIAENNDCKWCGGDLSGRVENVDGVTKVAVECDDCRRDYV